LGHNSSEKVWRFRNAAKSEDDGWPDCPYCESPFPYLYGEIDHIVPLASCTDNSDNNLILICPDCNKSKHSKPLHLWAKENQYCLGSIYDRLSKKGKRIPEDMLKHLGYIK